MSFWLPTLAFAGVLILSDGVLALLMQRYDDSGHATQALAWWIWFLMNARFPLYVLSGVVAGYHSTVGAGFLSGLVVAGLDGTLGWLVSAYIMRSMLARTSATRAKPSTRLIATVFSIAFGALLGGAGAWVGQLLP
jgi:hypothetical protein